MTKKTTGGPAFPFAFAEQDHVSDGMTLRDYFAGEAMSEYIHENYADSRKSRGGCSWSEIDIAELAYQQADAMIKARKA